MTVLIGFAVYRTETLVLGGVTYLVRFTRRKDATEYALFVTDHSGAEHMYCSYSADIAEDFMKLNGEELGQYVYRQLEAEIQRHADLIG